MPSRRPSRRLLPASHDATVDREDDPGDPLRLIRCKEQQRLCGILGLAIASQKMHRVEGWEHLGDLLGREEGVEHRRLDHAGRDPMHTNVVGSEVYVAICRQRMNVSM